MKRKEMLIIVIAVLVAATILFLISRLNQQKNYNWFPGYQSNSDEPYGCEIIHELLASYFSNHDLVDVNTDLSEKLDLSTQKHATYLFLGSFPYYTQQSFSAISDFVKRGNDAVIICESIPVKLVSLIGLTYADQTFTDSTDWQLYPDSLDEFATYDEDITATSSMLTPYMTLNFTATGFRTSDGYPYTYQTVDKANDFEWVYMIPDYVDQFNNLERLGTMQSRHFTNFVRFKYGEGYFYIHTTPIAFTNYYVIEEDKMEYVNKVLSYLEPGPIFWDNYSQSYNPIKNNSRQEEGPLRFILANPALRAAWYTMLAGLVLFLLFRTKRLQKPIAILEPNENRSLEFVQTIGRMYFLRSDHKHIAHQKIKLFLHFVQDRYQLPAAHIDDEFKQKLQLKSEVSQSSINEIFKHANYINNTTEVTEQDIIQLHQLIDNFHKHCK